MTHRVGRPSTERLLHYTPPISTGIGKNTPQRILYRLGARKKSAYELGSLNPNQIRREGLKKAIAALAIGATAIGFGYSMREAVEGPDTPKLEDTVEVKPGDTVWGLTEQRLSPEKDNLSATVHAVMNDERNRKVLEGGLKPGEELILPGVQKDSPLGLERENAGKLNNNE